MWVMISGYVKSYEFKCNRIFTKCGEYPNKNNNGNNLNSTLNGIVNTKYTLLFFPKNMCMQKIGSDLGYLLIDAKTLDIE